MVELISRVSKGTKMDQVYIPKRRAGLGVGSYVVIRPLKIKAIKGQPFFYGVKYLEPIKSRIIDEAFETVDELMGYDNLLITGSFLDEGFRFNDIDLVVISDSKIDSKFVEDRLKDRIGVKFHLIPISNKALIKGISTDPLYASMISKCVARKRFIYKAKPKINYKLLDLHLLKSEMLVENFDILTGNQKYHMVRNLVAIVLFIDRKEVTKKNVDLAINRIFGSETCQKLKDNVVLREDFLNTYKKIYKDTQAKIFRGIKYESKQK